MKLHAISDLHVGFAANQRLLDTLGDRGDDWLIVAGDVGEREEHLVGALRPLAERFAKVLWVPGNHELWTLPGDPLQLRGEVRYRHLVSVCRDLGVLTPEDPYPLWPGGGPRTVLAPLFLLYDYSFRPDHVDRSAALDWARESGVECVDEAVLHPDPHPTREAWCAARCDETEARLAAIPADTATVLVNHFPLRRDLAVLPAIPRFSLWCGTRRTEDWHVRFRARVVVSGHLHIRSTRWRDGVRFEEVSLGYPRQWRQESGAAAYLREILPGPA